MKISNKSILDTLQYADVIIHVTKHKDKYIVTFASDLKTKELPDFSHDRAEVELFIDFEDFIKDHIVRNIYFSIYRDPYYE